MDTEEHELSIVSPYKDIPEENCIRRIYSDICFEDWHFKLPYVRHPNSFESLVHVAAMPLV